MATRLYLHAASSSVSGTLPSSEQSDRTTSGDFDLQSNNRLMDTSVGSSQSQFDKTVALSLSTQYFYISRWVSPPLDETSISAETWTTNIAAKSGHADGLFPNWIYANIYVWRPSTGAKIGTVLDDEVGSSYLGGNVSETVKHRTQAGSGVSCQAGDVLVCEVWIVGTTFSNGNYNCSFYYDGTTANTTDGASVSNHASFIETPQDLSFQTGEGPGEPVECSVTSKIVTNKFIEIAE